MAKRTEAESHFTNAEKIILDLGQTTLPDSLRRFRFDPEQEIRVSPEEGAAVFLPTPVKLPDHDPVVETVLNGFWAQVLRKKPRVEEVVHQRPVQYDEQTARIRPYLEGSTALTLTELMKLNQAEKAAVCRMIKTHRGEIVISLPLYKWERENNQKSILNSMIARQSPSGLSAFLVLSTGFDNNNLTDKIRVVMGRVGTLMQLNPEQIEQDKAMGVLRSAFDAEVHTRGTTGEFFEAFVTDLRQMESKGTVYSVYPGDLNSALKMALTLEASVSKDWQLAYEEMEAKQQLLNVLGARRNAAIAAMSILFDPVTENDAVFALPEEHPAEIEARFVTALSSSFGRVTTWGELVKVLNDTKIKVTTRQDEQLVRIMTNVAPDNMKNPARVSKASTNLGDALDANPVYIGARIKTIMDIRRQMIEREGVLGNLQTLVTGAQTAFEAKQAHALLSFITAAEQAISLELAVDAGNRTGQGVNARFLNHAIRANADLPPARQLEQTWSAEQARGDLIESWAQQAIKLLSDGADSGSSDNQ